MIHNNPLRNGNFTSSEIFALTKKSKSGGLGAPALNYIEECNMERRAKKALEAESNARPIVWGKLLEPYGFNKLGIEYQLCSHQTIQHPDFDCWTGSPDGIKKSTVFDLKCPMTLKSFCQMVDPFRDENGNIIHEALTIQAVINNHKDGEKFYWQLVSNSILAKSTHAELIVFIPYKSELQNVRDLAQNSDGIQSPISWIYWAEDSELPHILDGGHYKSVNIIPFEVPQSDKDFLTERVEMASKLLIPRD